MIAGRPCSAPIVFAIADRAAAPTLPVRRALASHGTFDVDRRKLLAEDSVAIPLSMGEFDLIRCPSSRSLSRSTPRPAWDG